MTVMPTHDQFGTDFASHVQTYRGFVFGLWAVTLSALGVVALIAYLFA
jgi:hypothetical protein